MDELIERFCSITGATTNIAQQFLQMTNGDIDNAITYYFDSEQATDADIQGSILFDESRTPIPQKHERLIDPELPVAFNVRRRQPLDRGVFSVDPQNRASTSIGHSSLNGSGATLEKMFEPPLDILFNGTFAEAKDRAKQNNAWLLVSVHNNDIFDCHRLNRDLWKNTKIKALIKRSFVFWQVLFNKAEAQDFVQWYDYNKDDSHLAVIDPVTGESKIRLMGNQLSSASTTYKTLHEFVLNNNRANNIARKRPFDIDSDPDLVDMTDSIPHMKRMKIISPSNSMSFTELSDEPDLTCTERWYDYMGQEADPIFTVLIRLPSGDRDMISLPSSSKLKALFLYISEKGCELDKYELVKCFPKKTLTMSMGHVTLAECGLVNKDTLHVQERM